jgi:hypothetical protein
MRTHATLASFRAAGPSLCELCVCGEAPERVVAAPLVLSPRPLESLLTLLFLAAPIRLGATAVA